MSTLENLDALSLDDLYRAVPTRNLDASTRPAGDGLVVEVPLKKPAGVWRILSLFVSMPSRHRMFVDKLGAALLDECDGNKNVRDIITGFAEQHRLSFLESRELIMIYLKKLIEKGVVAVMVKQT